MTAPEFNMDNMRDPNNIHGDFVHTSVLVRQRCLSSPILFYLYLENVMHETLHNIYTSISIGGRLVCNLRFADEIDVITLNGKKPEEVDSFKYLGSTIANNSNTTKEAKTNQRLAASSKLFKSLLGSILLVRMRKLDPQSRS